MGAALGILVFFSDYFSPLFVGNVMRPITDKAKVSREKLAWLCDCTSAPVCITLPFTAWGVYVAGLVVGFGTFATADAGQAAVIHSIPFQLYGILTIVMILLVALGFLPDYGPMKKAEERARTTGKVVADGDTPMLSRELDTIKPKEGFKSNIILHFLDPRSDRYRRDHRHLCHHGLRQDAGGLRAGRYLSGHRAADPEGLQHP